MADTPKIRLPYGSTNHLRLVPTSGELEQGEGSASGEANDFFYRGLAYSAELWQQWLGLTEEGGFGPPKQSKGLTALKELKEFNELIRGYCLSKDKGEAIPCQQGQPAFFWDSASIADTRMVENEFQLLAASLEELNIESLIGGKCLSIKPSFEVSYKTSAFAAQLGEIRLVNTPVTLCSAR